MNEKPEALEETTPLLDETLLKTVATDYEHSDRRRLSAHQKPSFASDPPIANFSHGSANLQANPVDAPKSGLNWSRILKYTVLMFIATFVVGFFVGVAVRLAVGPRGNRPEWFQLALGLGSLSAMGVLFVLLSYKQQQRPLVHVLMVGLISWLISLPNVFLFGQPLAQWVGLFFSILLVSIISVPIGLGLRARKQIEELKVPRTVQ